MPTFRIRALVDGRMRRSWGESIDAETARADATKQLSKVTKNFEIVSVEEVSAMQANAEYLVGQAIDPTMIKID